MPPAEYAKQLQPTNQAQASLGMDKVSRKKELDTPDNRAEILHTCLGRILQIRAHNNRRTFISLLRFMRTISSF